jgi:hypothetical protein
MSERTVAIVEPNVTNGVVVNVQVPPPPPEPDEE